MTFDETKIPDGCLLRLIGPMPGRGWIADIEDETGALARAIDVDPTKATNEAIREYKEHMR